MLDTYAKRETDKFTLIVVALASMRRAIVSFLILEIPVRDLPLPCWWQREESETNQRSVSEPLRFVV